MAKSMTIGVYNVARKVKQPSIGVHNVARKVKRGFVEVDEVARQFFSCVDFNLAEHITSGENIRSGDTPIYTYIFNNTTLSLTAEGKALGDGKNDYFWYEIGGLNAGDILEIQYEYTVFAHSSPSNLELDGHEDGLLNSSYVWGNHASSMSLNSPVTYTKTVNVTANNSKFTHRLSTNGDYRVHHSVNVKSIILNGEQIFPY